MAKGKNISEVFGPHTKLFYDCRRLVMYGSLFNFVLFEGFSNFLIARTPKFYSVLAKNHLRKYIFMYIFLTCFKDPIKGKNIDMVSKSDSWLLYIVSVLKLKQIIRILFGEYLLLFLTHLLMLIYST